MSQRALAITLLLLLAAFALPGLTLLGVGAVVTPEALEAGTVVLTPPCPLALAGEPCNTCGLTRSFVAMGHLRLVDAWHYHRAGPPLYLGTWAGVLLLAWMAMHLVRTELQPAGGVRGRTRV